MELMKYREYQQEFGKLKERNRDRRIILWFLPGAFVIVAVSAIRLSYFNMFGLIDDSTYMGLALDNNVTRLSSF